MSAVTQLSRRDLLKAGTVVGGGLVIGFVVPGGVPLTGQRLRELPLQLAAG